MGTPANAWSISELLHGLQDPSAYPHPVHDLDVIQTHVSCVFRTGRYVYKVKKPVQFAFLDYSTPERRRYCCEQELALNRRLCPDLYLEVVPIIEEQNCLCVGGPGSPIEWAVKMAQMNDEDMLPARLEAGSVGNAEVDRLAYTLADFHATAPVPSYPDAFGAPQAVARTIRDTLHVMDTATGAGSFTEAHQAIRKYIESFLENQVALLNKRLAAGRIRDCHGDLRTQNICLDARFSQGQQIFDCIEFNDSLRYIDTAADLAYLTMDLDLTGRADLRLRLVEAYCRRADDAELMSVLPYYQVYRACVRGNIALLAAAEPEVPEQDRLRQQQSAATAYDLAWCYSQRRQRPALLITVGFSGSGKSVLARDLCRRLPAVYLSSDGLRKEIEGIPATTPLDRSSYTIERRATVYKTLRTRAEEYLARGEHVLLDATFLSAAERNRAAEVAERSDAEFWILECQCPDTVIRERLHSRHRDRNASDADLEVYEAQRRSFQPVVPSEVSGRALGQHIVLHTDQPVAETAHYAVRWFATLS